MRKIQLSDHQFNQVVKAYQQRYIDLNRELYEVSTLLSSLKQGEAIEGELPEELLTEDLKKANKTTATSVKGEVKILKKRGRKKLIVDAVEKLDLSKIDWEDFITNTLRNRNELLTANEIRQKAIEGYNLQDIPTKEISNKMSPILRVLRETDKIRRLKIPQHISYFYALPEWYEEDGQIKNQFLEKLEMQYLQPKKRGRKRKVNFDFPMIADLIIAALKDTKTVLLVDDFVEYARKRYNFSTKERKEYMDNIKITLKQLFSAGHIKRIQLQGSGDYQYALPHWFEKDGELSRKYRA